MNGPQTQKKDIVHSAQFIEVIMVNFKWINFKIIEQWEQTVLSHDHNKMKEAKKNKFKC